MIRLFFKTVWNNRKRNALVFIEMLMISFVLVNLTTYLMNMMAVYRIKNCYNTDNVVLISISKKEDEAENITEQAFSNLRKMIEGNSFVENVSISNNALPYNYNLYSTDFNCGDLNFNLALRQVDIDYASVMKIKTITGRWFDITDYGKAVKPVIISRQINDKYFNGDAVGKRIEQGKAKIPYEIIGVVDEFKRGDFERPYACGFLFKDKIDAKSFWGTAILVRTSEAKAGEMLKVAENQVYSVLDPGKWTINSLNSLDNMRAKQNEDNARSTYMGLIIAVFIMINVFLGTIGILWYNTNLRVHEIGIKRALGSSGSGIKKLLIAENLFIAGFALTFVTLILVQLPAFTGGTSLEEGVFEKSALISVMTMIVLVLLSTWIPALIASKIHPAQALKTE